MTDALKPCPFCGEKEVRRFGDYVTHQGYTSCSASVMNATDEQWNTRAESQRIAELEAENQQLRDKNEVLANSVKAMEMRVMKFVNAHYTIEEKLQDNAIKESER